MHASRQVFHIRISHPNFRTAKEREEVSRTFFITINIEFRVNRTVLHVAVGEY